MKITNHHELRHHVELDCSSPILTDQSFKNACDINVIMSNYAKTGMLGHVNESEPKYIDNTIIPDLAKAYDIVNLAEQMFFDLPANVRKLMDNDPSQLENFINNPENKDVLLKSGLIIDNTPQVKEPISDKLVPGGNDGENNRNSGKNS